MNLGPHALYRHGGFEAWRNAQKLMPPTAYPSLTGLRLIHAGRLRRLPTPLLPMMRHAVVAAPVERSFRDWSSEVLGAEAAEAAIGFAALPTFHADPGELSAAFVQERIRRSCMWRPVRYVLGGWCSLVEALERRARALGVDVVLRSGFAELPERPVIVATDLPTAARLLGDPGIA